MASACALAIISGKIIFIFGIAERLRTLRYAIFTGRKLPQSKPDGFASSLREGASGETGNFALWPGTFPLCQRLSLWESWRVSA